MTANHSLRKFLIAGLVLLIALPLLGKGLEYLSGPDYSPEVVRFHDTQLQIMNGPVFEQVLQNQQTGHTLLFAYASWCPHCKRQFAIIDEVRKLFPQENLHVIYAGIDRDAMELSKFLVERYGNTVPFTPYHVSPGDARESFAENLKQRGLTFEGTIPYLVVFDQDKKVVKERLGVTSAADLRILITGLYEALPEPATPEAPTDAENLAPQN